MRLLAEVGGVNIVTSDDVTGSVTIRMRDVPWDQALDVIMEAKGLGAERKGNLIRVAPQAVLEKERELAIARKTQQVAAGAARDAARAGQLRHGQRPCSRASRR